MRLLENIGQVIISASCGTFKRSWKTHDAHRLQRRHTGSSAHMQHTVGERTHTYAHIGARTLSPMMGPVRGCATGRG